MRRRRYARIGITLHEVTRIEATARRAIGFDDEREARTIRETTRTCGARTRIGIARQPHAGEVTTLDQAIIDGDEQAGAVAQAARTHLWAWIRAALRIVPVVDATGVGAIEIDHLDTRTIE